MSDSMSADEAPLVGHDRVRQTVQAMLRTAQASGWTDAALETASGVKARCIKSYRVEGKEPSLSAALSLAVVIGPRAVNMILAIIGYVGNSIEDAEAQGPAYVAAEAMCHLGRFAKHAADNRIDHIERPDSEDAVDNVIELLVPFSSRGNAA
jgi:hypothetical protein